MADVRVDIFNKIRTLSLSHHDKALLCSSLMNLADGELQKLYEEIEKDDQLLQDLANITVAKSEAITSGGEENVSKVEEAELNMLNRLIAK